MRKIIVGAQVSIDGIMQAPGRQGMFGGERRRFRGSLRSNGSTAVHPDSTRHHCTFCQYSPSQLGN